MLVICLWTRLSDCLSTLKKTMKNLMYNKKVGVDSDSIFDEVTYSGEKDIVEESNLLKKNVLKMLVVMRKVVTTNGNKQCYVGKLCFAWKQNHPNLKIKISALKHIMSLHCIVQTCTIRSFCCQMQKD